MVRAKVPGVTVNARQRRVFRRWAGRRWPTFPEVRPGDARDNLREARVFELWIRRTRECRECRGGGQRLIGPEGCSCNESGRVPR